MPPFAERFIDAASLKTELENSHKKLAKMSTRGQWKEVPDSTHLIAGSQPDAVADAVFDVIELIKK